MLTLFNFYLSEIVAQDGISVDRTYDFTSDEKRDLERLIKGFVPTQLNADSELEDLFMYKLGDKPIDNQLKEWKDSDMRLYVLRNLSKIIGFCLVNPVHRMLRNSALIHYLMIDEKYRSKGLGEFFLKTVINRLKIELPNKHLIINVFDKNEPAKKLYGKLGFRPGSIIMLKY